MLKNFWFVAGLIACGEKSGVDSGMSGELDQEGAAALWQSMDGYESWGSVAGWEGIVSSADGTHGPFVQIWANDLALGALESSSPFPDGAILVKRGYADAKGSPMSDSETVTVMQKVDGFDSDNNDWFWAVFDSVSGDVVGVAGTSASCTGCHAVDPDGDHVWFDDLEAPSR